MNITPSQYEVLYEQCYDAVQEAIVRVQDINSVSGDCSPELHDEFDQARQRFIDVMIKQILENNPKLSNE